MLGCGTYEVIAQPRGGRGAILGSIPWNELVWSRVLDDTSEATVSLNLADPACCGLLQEFRPWRHEVSIRRDGSEVWVGPLYTALQPPEQRQAVARDVTAWWDRRRIHLDHTYIDADLATIFQEVSDDAMAPDTSPGLTLEASPSGITSSQKYLAAQHLLAGPALRDIANIGIDWTAVRRVVLAGGTTVPTGRLSTLTDAHFTSPPQASIDGSAQRNSLVVRGSGGGEQGDTIYGVSTPDPGRVALDGLLEDVVTIDTVRDNLTAKAAADTRVSLLSDVTLVEESELTPTAPVTIDELVPGAVVPLMLASCIPVVGDYRLQKVSVSISAADNIESVRITVQPVGTE